MIVDALLLAPERDRENAVMVASVVGRFGFGISSPVSSLALATRTGEAQRQVLENSGSGNQGSSPLFGTESLRSQAEKREKLFR